MSNDFFNRLAVGQKYENILLDILNNNGIRAKLNNIDDVKDVDIELIDDDIYIDSKLSKTPFVYSYEKYGIKPENCILINLSHVKKYCEKEKITGKKVWIAFFVRFKEYNIKDLVFIPNSYLIYLIELCKSGKLNINLIENNKLRVDKECGRSLNEFKKYLYEKRKITKYKSK